PARSRLPRRVGQVLHLHVYPPLLDAPSIDHDLRLARQRQDRVRGEMGPRMQSGVPAALCRRVRLSARDGALDDGLTRVDQALLGRRKRGSLSSVGPVGGEAGSSSSTQARTTLSSNAPEDGAVTQSSMPPSVTRPRSATSSTLGAPRTADEATS